MIFLIIGVEYCQPEACSHFSTTASWGGCLGLSLSVHHCRFLMHEPFLELGEASKKGYGAYYCV